MTRFLKVAAVAAAVVLVTTSVAQAQRQGEGRRGGRGFGFFGRGGGGGIGAVALLRIEKVQADLGLDLEQGEQIQQLQEDMSQARRDMFAGLRDLSREEQRERFAEMREKMEKLAGDMREKLNGVLSDEQSNRLDQISLQVRGAGALADEKVTEKLDVSDEQQAKMEEIREENQTARRELFQSLRGGGGDFDRDAMREKMQEMQASHTEKMLAALTDSQREAFAAMQGEKLELTPEDMRGAFGGFGGRGRGGEGRGGRRGQGRGNQ